MGWYNQADNSYVITDRYVVVFFQSIAKDLKFGKRQYSVCKPTTYNSWKPVKNIYCAVVDT
jgi:hypothetical protein